MPKNTPSGFNIGNILKTILFLISLAMVCLLVRNSIIPIQDNYKSHWTIDINMFKMLHYHNCILDLDISPTLSHEGCCGIHGMTSCHHNHNLLTIDTHFYIISYSDKRSFPSLLILAFPRKKTKKNKYNHFLINTY